MISISGPRFLGWYRTSMGSFDSLSLRLSLAVPGPGTVTVGDLSGHGHISESESSQYNFSPRRRRVQPLRLCRGNVGQQNVCQE